ncbi:MAG: hypothetical protein ABIV51_12655, partial [Saprospiraceae bacterium]
VKYGVRASKIYGGLIGIVLFIFSLYFFIYNITFSYLTLILWLTTIIFPIVILLFLFFKADSIKEYHNVQKKLKLFMLAGFVGFLFLI